MSVPMYDEEMCLLKYASSRTRTAVLYADSSLATVAFAIRGAQAPLKLVVVSTIAKNTTTEIGTFEIPPDGGGVSQSGLRCVQFRTGKRLGLPLVQWIVH